MPINNRKARNVHNVLLPVWQDSYRHIYQICTGPDAPSISHALNEIIRQWVENDKKRIENDKKRKESKKCTPLP